MDRPTLQSLLHEADGRVQQLELNVAFQRKLMGTLNQVIMTLRQRRCLQVA